MLIDLHSHSTLSDGTRSIEEMVMAAEQNGYQAFAMTDHVRHGDSAYRDVVPAVREEIERLRPQTAMQLFVGAEITDFPPPEIATIAWEVRRDGADVVVVHGECVSLDTAGGTNAQAVRCPEVDILGHPGLISEEDAEAAAHHGIYLELSAIVGASYANGHVYEMARRTAASIVVDSDAHDEAGLLTPRKVAALVRGAGGSELYLHQVQHRWAPALINKLVRRYSMVS